MKITAHLNKISWSIADKGLYVGYGLVQLLQVKALPPDVYGVFALLVALNTWIMIVSDGSALTGIIQFGTDVKERRRVNALALLIHVTIVALGALVVLILKEPLSQAFNEPRFLVVATMLPVYLLLTLPRMFCLKLIYREMRMRDLFLIDLVWFGVRTGMTIWALTNDSLNTLEDIIRIDFIGMGASSVVAIWLTRKEFVFGWNGEITVGQYLRYGIPLAIATALNSTPRQLDVMVVAAYFGVGVVGVYNLAKNLFRFFEQAFDAVQTLVYPAAVRMLVQHRQEDLQILITKAISVTLIPSLMAVAILELGASNLIVFVLGPQYAGAVGHFNILVLAAIGLPFYLMGAVINALGHSTALVKYSAIGLATGMLTLFVLSELGLEWAIGFGLVVNTWVVGILCTMHVRRNVHFPLRSILRAFDDLKHMIANRGRA